jgi:hypothetical protein
MFSTHYSVGQGKEKRNVKGKKRKMGKGGKGRG